MPLVLVAALMLSLLPAGPANASAGATNTGAALASFERMTAGDGADEQNLVAEIQQFENTYAEDTSSDAEVDITNVRSEMEAGRITTHLPESAGILVPDVRVWVADSGERMVFLPYVGSVVAPSGMTVFLDVHGSVTQTLETVYQAKGADSGTFAVWVDGLLQRHAFVDASGSVSDLEGAPTTARADAVSPQDHGGGWWHEFTWCLTDLMAIPSWVLGAISAACAAACLITAGLGCKACVAGVVAGYSAEIGFCVGWASGG